MFDPTKVPDEVLAEMRAIVQATADNDYSVATPARYKLAKALTTPLRSAVLVGDITDMFTKAKYEPGTHIEYPIDAISPGIEGELSAYTLPNYGRIPEKSFEGDYVSIPTYEVGGAIDWPLKYAREARWDIVARFLQALSVQFIKKSNDDAWHTLLAAGVDRNILVYDATAAAGQFTKRLVSLMKTVMRRNGGGNSSSVNRQVLTDLYISPEAHEDIRNWNVDQVDDSTRREIYLATDEQISRIFQVNLRVIDELGAGQEYQLYYTSQLGGALGPNSDVELVVGLNRSPANTLIQPIVQPVQIFPDPTLHRQRRDGYYAWKEQGFAVLDGRYVILGSF